VQTYTHMHTYVHAHARMHPPATHVPPSGPQSHRVYMPAHTQHTHTHAHTHMLILAPARSLIQARASARSMRQVQRHAAWRVPRQSLVEAAYGSRSCKQPANAGSKQTTTTRLHTRA
jgi:hypothetical protein